MKISVLLENRAKSNMVLYTGSAISAKPTKRFHRIFPNQKIYPPDVQSWTETVEIFNASGYVKVNVFAKDKAKNVKLYLIKEYTFPLLFGRDWISKFNIFSQKLKSLNEVGRMFDSLQALLIELTDLFANTLGEIKRMKAELLLEKDMLLLYFVKLQI